MSRTPYDLSRIRAVVFDVDGVLSPSTVAMDSEGRRTRMVNIKDGYAMQLAVKRGLKLAIITGADTPNIVGRYNSLGITDVFLKASHKEPVLRQWMADSGFSSAEVA